MGSLFGVRYTRIEKEKKMIALEVRPEVLKEETLELSEESADSNSS